jgi:hypothetical protein
MRIGAKIDSLGYIKLTKGMPSLTKSISHKVAQSFFVCLRCGSETTDIAPWIAISRAGHIHRTPLSYISISISPTHKVLKTKKDKSWLWILIAGVWDTD